MTLIAPRRATRVLHVGDVKVGGENPIVVQSMTTADTRDPIATLRQVHELTEAGCEIVRIAVPDRKGHLQRAQHATFDVGREMASDRLDLGQLRHVLRA